MYLADTYATYGGLKLIKSFRLSVGNPIYSGNHPYDISNQQRRRQKNSIKQKAI